MSRAAPRARSPDAAPRAGEDEFILVAVLWLLAALAGLAAIYLTYALDSASAAFLPAERLQAEAAIRAGVELAAYQVLAAPRRRARPMARSRRVWAARTSS